jgi:hypothetical protein
LKGEDLKPAARAGDMPCGIGRHNAARSTIAVDRSAVEAMKPRRARAKEGTGFGSAEFTGSFLSAQAG